MHNDTPSGATEAEVSPDPPVTLVRRAQFLPSCERDALYEAVCENRQAFQRPAAPGTDGGRSSYLSLESVGEDPPGSAAIRAASGCLAKRILESLPLLCADLNVEPFPISEIPLTLVNGMDGHRGLPHADSIDGRFRISILYYFHKVPKVFSGGDLEFYEPGTTAAEGEDRNALVRIGQEDNLLVAFPSDTFHGITEVRCKSDDFADGRFAAIGFLGPE